MRSRSILLLSLGLMGLPGCPEPAHPPTCAEGLVADGERCVPWLDDCPGRFEVPVLGGGCQPVGVTACATGMAADGEGGCAPVLPDGPCAPGTLPRLGETVCQPVGVTTCAAGMVSDGEGGCAPILPPLPCNDGLLERLGSEVCEPLQDCGEAPWGTGPLDATAVFVDASALPGAGDGSAGAPFAFVSEAVAAAAPGGQVVLASGRYLEAVLVDRPLRLQGRCAAEVTIEGPEGPFDATGPLTILAGATGTRVTGVTFTGGGRGVNVSGATDVVLEAVVVRDTRGAGLYVQGGGSATVRRARLERATGHGLFGLGSDLRVEDSVIQSTRPREDGRYGRGLTMTCDEAAGRCGGLVVERSLLRANRGFGIITFGQEVDVSDSVVTGTLPTADASTFGRGIDVECHAALASCSPARISGCVVSGNHDMGIYVGGVDAEITASVVEDTQPRPLSGDFGRGVDAECDAAVGRCGSVVIRQSVVRRNTDLGVFSGGVPLEVVETVVADQVARPVDGTMGRGILTTCAPDLEACPTVRIEGCLLERNQEAALYLAGADAEVLGSTVRGTRVRESDGLTGAGILAACNLDLDRCGQLRVEGTLVEDNPVLSIAAFGPDLTVRASAVRETRPSDAGMLGRGIQGGCNLVVPRCGKVVVDGVYVSRSRELGVALEGNEALVVRTTVRDTLPLANGKGYGRGINSRCEPVTGTCGALRVEDTVVSGSRSFGILVSGPSAFISRTAVVDTLPDAGADWEGYLGIGICVIVDADTLGDATLILVDSIVDDAYGGAVYAAESSARVEGCRLSNIWPQVADSRHGYGIIAGSNLDWPGLWLEVERTVIRDADLAAVSLLDVDCEIHRSRFSGGDFAMVYSGPLRLVVGDDNDLSGSVSSKPTRNTSQTLVPSAPPIDAVPPDL